MMDGILLGAACYICGMLHLIWKQLEAAKQARINQTDMLHSKIDALSQEIYRISSAVDRADFPPNA